MKRVYVIWNMTNYDSGYEIAGGYSTLEAAQRAYHKEMLRRYGTIDEDKLLDLWDHDYGTDSWRIIAIDIKE